MESIWKILIGIAIVSQPLVIWIVYRKLKKQKECLPTLSTNELQDLVAKQTLLSSNQVIEELKSRGEDVRFALPHLFKLALEKNKAAQLVAWGVLKTHFASDLPGLDFSVSRPSVDDRNWMQSKLDGMGSQQASGG